MRWALLLAAAAACAQTPLQDSQSALAKGDYERAIRIATEAEAHFAASGQLREQAQAANLLGQASAFRGEYAAALTAFERSRALDRKSGDGEAEVTVENNIGSIYFFQGRYVDALQAYEQALARTQQAQAEPWARRRLQLTLVNLAVLFEQLGQNGRALDYYRQANLTPTALPASEQAQLLSNLGTLYRRMGDPAGALATYNEAQRWFARQQHSDAEIHILHNLGILMTLDYRDTARALAAFDEALSLARSTGNKRQTVLGQLFRAEALYRGGRVAEARGGFAEALAGAREIGGREEEWTALYGLGRSDRQADPQGAAGEFAQSIAVIESVRAGLSRASLRTDFLAGKRDVYDAAIDLKLTAGQLDSAALFTLMEQARARNLQDTLRRPQERATLAAVQAKLAPGALLIEYWQGAGRGAALWVTRDRSGPVLLPAAGDLRAFLSALERGGEWRQTAGAVGRHLLMNIPLDGISSVLVVPDGELQRIPFEALEVSGRLLIERARVSYLPVASMLLRPPRARHLAMPWDVQAALFGAPEMSGPAKLASDAAWQPLPHARAEMEAAARALPGRARIFAAAAARKAELVAVPGPAVLHFSTHAAVDLADANRSRILFSGPEYLFWREVQALNLARTDLITLSACDTEGGQHVRGEGILSFSRAFLSAGAASTVTTLWRVADQPTAEFMKQFYFELGHGAAKAEALRSAKLSFLTSGSPLAHPRYWAAFVLNGEGDAPLAPVISWLQMVGALALLAAAAAFWWRSKRRARAERVPR